LVLRGLVVATVVALAGTASPESRFTNRDYGHTLVVPAGWQAALARDSRTTNVSTYQPKRLDGFEEPPRGHLRIVLADYGRIPCPRGAIRAGERIELGRRVSFEGYVGFNVAFCRRGHSLQAFVPAGNAVPAARLEQARRIIASVRLTRRADEVANERSLQLLGRSVEGRPIRAHRIGNPRSPKRVLVFGCVHGDECAGMRVTQLLVNLTRPIDVDLWVVQDLNPDGHRQWQRGNARGIDLNRDFRAVTQRETRIARKLILRLRPDATIWYHQPQAVVRAWGPSRATARRYARLAGEPYRSLEWPPGSASRWQNGIGLVSFVVELPPGDLTFAGARRHARAVLELVE
jgi:murein peptide amidase A